MAVQRAHTLLVHPGKEIGKTQIVDATVSLTGGMLRLAARIHAGPDAECDVDITFGSSPDGKQRNDYGDPITWRINAKASHGQN